MFFGTFPQKRSGTVHVAEIRLPPRFRATTAIAEIVNFRMDSLFLILCSICLRWAIAIFRMCGAKPVMRLCLLNVFDGHMATGAHDLSVGTRHGDCF